MSDVIQHVVHSVDTLSIHLSAVNGKIEAMMHPVDFSKSKGRSIPAEEISDDIQQWVQAISLCISQTQEMKQNLESIAATTNGQLTAVQEVNHTAARLSQMASELRRLIASFEI